MNKSTDNSRNLKSAQKLGIKTILVKDVMEALGQLEEMLGFPLKTSLSKLWSMKCLK